MLYQVAPQSVDSYHPSQASPISCVARQSGQVDGAIIVGAGQQMTRVARRHRERWLVLLLQERIATGERSAADHVDIAAGDLRVHRCDKRRNRTEQDQNKTGKKRT